MTVLVETEVEEQALIPFQDHFRDLPKGTNLLVKTDSEYVLMKYEGHDTEVEEAHVHRLNRHTNIGTIPILSESGRRSMALPDHQRQHQRFKGNILATHCLRFEHDPEFDEFWPTAYNSDLYLTLATQYKDGHIETQEKDVEICVDDDLIRKKLQSFVRPGYIESVIEPFLMGEPTKFRVPRWKLRTWGMLMPGLQARYIWATRNLEHGSFVYVGCKEEVFLLGVAKGDNGKPFMQGTYTSSTKPPLYFTNAYLDHMSPSDMKRPMWRGKGGCNVAYYRTSNPPDLKGKLFVCPQMGRSQNCKYTVFTGHPDLITGDLDRALVHFEKTDFAEYADIVEKYAKTIDTIHESNGPPNGHFYF